MRHPERRKRHRTTHANMARTASVAFSLIFHLAILYVVIVGLLRVAG